MTKGRKLPRARYVAFLSLSVTQDTTKPAQGAELVIPQLHNADKPKSTMRRT